MTLVPGTWPTPKAPNGYRSARPGGSGGGLIERVLALHHHEDGAGPSP